MSLFSDLILEIGPAMLKGCQYTLHFPSKYILFHRCPYYSPAHAK